MKRLAIRMLCLAFAMGAPIGSQAGEQPLVTAGDFVKIYDPGVGESVPWYINDHCFIYGKDGLWHLYGITHKEPASPMEERVLAHATASTLLQSPWKKQDFALTYAPEAPWNEIHLWAPYVIFNEGTYYMYYCAGDRDHAKYKIHLATSKDLWTWVRHPKNPMVVDGYDARDPFVMRVGDKWVMYYDACSEPTYGNHVVASVTSSDLLTWGDRKIVFVDPSKGTSGGPTESPFVVRRGAHYYLFIGPRNAHSGTDVFVSEDPFHWKIEDKVGHIASHAAEVVRDTDGKWYVSRCGWGEGGVYLAPLTWHDGEEKAETSLTQPELVSFKGAAEGPKGELVGKD